jgi:hypothetical protein
LQTIDLPPRAEALMAYASVLAVTIRAEARRVEQGMVTTH